MNAYAYFVVNHHLDYLLEAVGQAAASRRAVPAAQPARSDRVGRRWRSPGVRPGRPQRTRPAEPRQLPVPGLSSSLGSALPPSDEGLRSPPAEAFVCPAPSGQVGRRVDVAEGPPVRIERRATPASSMTRVGERIVERPEAPFARRDQALRCRQGRSPLAARPATAGPARRPRGRRRRPTGSSRPASRASQDGSTIVGMSPPTTSTTGWVAARRPARRPTSGPSNGGRVAGRATDAVRQSPGRSPARRRRRSPGRPGRPRRSHARGASGRRSARRACRARSGSNGRRPGRSRVTRGRLRSSADLAGRRGARARERARRPSGGGSRAGRDPRGSPSRSAGSCRSRRGSAAGVSGPAAREGQRPAGQLAVGRRGIGEVRLEAARSARHVPAPGDRPAGSPPPARQPPAAAAPERRALARAGPSRPTWPDPTSPLACDPGSRTDRAVADERAPGDQPVAPRPPRTGPPPRRPA